MIECGVIKFCYCAIVKIREISILTEINVRDRVVQELNHDYHNSCECLSAISDFAVVNQAAYLVSSFGRMDGSLRNASVKRALRVVVCFLHSASFVELESSCLNLPPHHCNDLSITYYHCSVHPGTPIHHFSLLKINVHIL